VIRFGEVWLDPTRIAGFTIQAMRYQGTSGYGVYAILDAGGRALLERYEDEADAREYVAQLVKEHDARRSGGCREEKANADGTWFEHCRYEYAHPGRHSWEASS